MNYKQLKKDELLHLCPSQVCPHLMSRSTTRCHFVFPGRGADGEAALNVGPEAIHPLLQALHTSFLMPLLAEPGGGKHQVQEQREQWEL